MSHLLERGANFKTSFQNMKFQNVILEYEISKRHSK